MVLESDSILLPLETVDKENGGDDDESSEEEQHPGQYVLAAHSQLQDLVALKGWNWTDLILFLSAAATAAPPLSANEEGESEEEAVPKTIWTDDSSCFLTMKSSDSLRPPSDHRFQMDIQCVWSTSVSHGVENDNNSNSNSSSKVARKDHTCELLLSARDAEAARETLLGILRILLSSTSLSVEDVIFKCFATNPRQEFPRLLLSSSPDDDNESALTNLLSPCPTKINFLRLHFVALTKETCRVLANLVDTRFELRQCTVQEGGYQNILSGLHPQQQQQHQARPSKLELGCTTVEFAKFAMELEQCSSADSTTPTVLQSLEMQLHFYLQGTGMETFCRALEQNSSLIHLSMSYLDMDDAHWNRLFQSLHSHPKLQSLTLKFTDNFVDNFRRLTPERRTARTRAVVHLLQANKCIQKVAWPAFQQDETLMEQVGQLLEENSRSATLV